jgi:hypothetical protein
MFKWSDEILLERLDEKLNIKPIIIDNITDMILIILSSILTKYVIKSEIEKDKIKIIDKINLLNLA